MKVEILKQTFDPWRVLSEYRPQESLHGSSAASAGKYGAAAVFIGAMRKLNEGDAVQAMQLEHYPEMTRAHIERTIEQVAAEHMIGDALVMHRVGEVKPGETIVLVATWAEHRRNAYAANRLIMEDLKSKAPFWKREILSGGARWVEANTPGY